MPSALDTSAGHGQILLVRVVVVLATTFGTSVCLPLLAVLWFETRRFNPAVDLLAETAVRFHDLSSSGTFYAMLVYNLLDVACETKYNRSISSRVRLTVIGRGPKRPPSRPVQPARALSCGPVTNAPSPEVESQLEYQQASITFLTDALDEAQAAHKHSQTQLTELRCQIEQQGEESKRQSGSIASLHTALADAQADREHLEGRLEQQRHQMNAQNDGIQKMEAELMQLRSSETQKTEQIEALRAKLATVSAAVEHGRAAIEEDEGDAASDVPAARPLPLSPLQTWRSTHKMLLTARIKPSQSSRPLDGPMVSRVSFCDDGRHYAHLRDVKSGNESRHQFDHCFSPTDTNEDVWKAFTDLLLGGFHDNYDVGLVTDGPSGSGKTFSTIKGKHALIFTAIHNILQYGTGTDRVVQVRAIEVYRNDLVDIVEKMQRKSDSRASPSRSPARRPVGPWQQYRTIEFRRSATLEDVQRKMLEVNHRRTNKDTAMNTSKSSLKGGSSRGHLVLIISHVEEGAPATTANKLAFIDLAGTEERGVNDLNIDAEYDDIRKDRSDCYFYFKNFHKATPTPDDRMLVKLLRSVFCRPLESTRIAHFFHLSTTDHERNMLLMTQKRELENFMLRPRVEPDREAMRVQR